MKNLKSVVAGLLFGTILVLGVPALQATEASPPTFSGGVMFRDPSFVGIQAGIIDRTIAPVEIDSNDQGLLYAICRQGVSTDDYALAWDYYTALVPLSEYVGMLSSNGEHLANLDQLIAPYVFGNVVDSTATDYIPRTAQAACWIPPWPIRYESGLIGIQNSAEGYSLYYYRTDDGQNPY